MMLVTGEPQRILGRIGIDFVAARGATYHFNRGLNLFGAVDHIGATRGVTVAAGPEVLRKRYGAVWPSDHYPVYVDLVLPD